MALVLLDLAGGEGVSDLDMPAGDEGSGRILRGSAGLGKSSQQRRALNKRLHKEHKRSVPSPSSVSRYLCH
jgi:hypothetical protein